MGHIARRGVQSRQRRCLFFLIRPDNSLPNDITTTGGRPPRPHSRHSPRLHSLISSRPFHSGGANDQCGATYLLTRSHSSTPHGSPSLVPLLQFLSFFIQEGVSTSTWRKFWQSRTTSWGTTLTFINVYILPSLLLTIELHPRL